MKTYLALGDSYTIGEGVSFPHSFPMQLVAAMRQKGTDVDDPLVIAQTGWTTDELRSAISEKGITATFDFVTLLIGVNNQYRGYDKNVYRHEFRMLLKQALSFAKEEKENICVLSIPDWSVTPFAEGRDRAKIAEEIEAFNEINRAETLAEGIRYLDITEISRRAAFDASLLAEDGLHPSANMYALWVEKWAG